MGYALENGHPEIIVNGRIFAIAAFSFEAPFGTLFTVGVFESKVDGWNGITKFALQCQPAELLPKIQFLGGIVEFNKWLIENLKQLLVSVFASAPPVTVLSEPKTYEEAVAAIQKSLHAQKLVLVNGVLTIL